MRCLKNCLIVTLDDLEMLCSSADVFLQTCFLLFCFDSADAKSLAEMLMRFVNLYSLFQAVNIIFAFRTDL